MKPKNTLFSYLFFTITILFGYAQKQSLFIDKDFGTVMQQAKLEKKPVIVMFYASWCVHCNKMKNDIFTNEEVISFYNQNYICMSVNVENKEGIALREKLKTKLIVKSFPTFCFFDENQNVTNSILGEFKVADFIKEGKENLLSENHLLNIKSKFESDVSNYNVCLSYIQIVKRFGLNPTEIAQNYLKTVSSENYYTEANWKLIANGITDFEAPEFLEMVKNKAQFEKAVSTIRVEKKINFVITESFKSFIENSDTLSYNKNRLIAEKFNLRKVDSLLFHQDLSFYERTFNWKAYHKTLEKNMPSFGLKDAQFINNVCANYFVYITDKKMLTKAVEWQKVALKLSPTLDKYVMICNLLIKTQDYKQALEYANQGKEFGQNLGFNTTEIENILSEIKSRLKK